MVALLRNWPRLFTYTTTIVIVFMMALVWVFEVYPMLSQHSASGVPEKGLQLLGILIPVSIGLLTPLVFSFFKFGQQKDLSDLTHSSFEMKCIGEATLLEAIDKVPAGIVMYDSNDQLIMCNKRFRDIWGYSAEDTYTGVTHQELGLIDVRNGVKVAGEAANEYMQNRLEYRAIFSDEQVVELQDGRLISTKDRPLTDGGFVSIQTDITELVEARNSFHKSEQQLLDAIEGLDQGFASFDHNDHLVIANSTYRKMYPEQNNSTTDMSFEDMIRLSVYAKEIPSATGCEEEWIAKRMEQHRNCCHISEQLLSNGDWVKTSERRTANNGTVCISTDISEAKKNQAILELHATTDEMTGTLNRRTGFFMLKKLMAQSQRSGNDLTISFIDIDDLKSVNDKFGHEKGDHLIKSISKAAKGVIREGDIIMRLGGDEFLIAFPGCTPILAEKKMDEIKLQLTCNKPLDNDIELNFSYGCTSYLSSPFKDIEEYVSHADKLMYENKLNRRAAHPN